MKFERGYGNERVYAPNGKLMYLSSTKRANWYLNRNLATKVDDGIILNFEPNGYGYHGDNYNLSEKHNRCVVCGVAELSLLTKHHIVPTIYRKYFPLEVKSRNSHDVVIICEDCHHEYEIEATNLKIELAKKYNIVNHQDINKIRLQNNLSNRKAYCIAKTLTAKNDKIPEYKRILMEIKFEMLSGLIANSENLESIINSMYTKNDEFDESHGFLIMKEISDLQEFTEMWRQHFLDIMLPDYMPVGWNVKRNIFTKI